MNTSPRCGWSERLCPELVLEAFATETAEQARSRSGWDGSAKVIELSGLDTDRVAAWEAPPENALPRCAELAGVR